MTSGERKCGTGRFVGIGPTGVQSWPLFCERPYCVRCGPNQIFPSWLRRSDLAYHDTAMVHVLVVDHESHETVARNTTRQAKNVEAPLYRLTVRLGDVDLMVSNVAVSDRSTGVLGRLQVEGTHVAPLVSSVFKTFHLAGGYSEECARPGEDGTRTAGRPITASRAFPAEPPSSSGMIRTEQFGSEEDGREFERLYHLALEDAHRANPSLPRDQRTLSRDYPEVIHACADDAREQVNGIGW